jgi:hypothetical protein
LIIIYVENLKNKNKRVGVLNEIKDYYYLKRNLSKQNLKKEFHFPHNILNRFYKVYSEWAGLGKSYAIKKEIEK